MGIHYITHQDILVITLYDGTVHLIYDLSTDPSMVPSDQPSSFAPPSAIVLSKAVRSVFARTQPESISFDDVNNIPGFTFYDDAGIAIWFQQ